MTVIVEQRMRLNPRGIFFENESIGPGFGMVDGQRRSLEETIVDLRDKRLSFENFPRISVYWHEEQNCWVTQDHRRLFCFQKAGLSAIEVVRIRTMPLYAKSIIPSPSIKVRCASNDSLTRLLHFEGSASGGCIFGDLK